MRAIDRFERFGTPVHNGQDYLKKHIFDQYPVVYDELEIADWEGTVDYVWLIDPDIKVYDSFPWYFRPQYNSLYIHAFPYVYKKSREVMSWEMVRLVPTKSGSYETKKHSYICGEYDPYYGKDKFEIFYIGDDRTSHNELIKRVPELQVVETFEQAQQRSNTDMFWLVYDDVLIRDTFKFSYTPDEWSYDFVHVFGNGDIDQLDGVALVPKSYNANPKEIEHRFFAGKKEIRIMASQPRQYDRFIIDTYEQYQEALEKTTTDLFWGMPSDIEILDNSIFNFYISHQDTKRKSNHAWLNGNKYDGLVLYSKHAHVTEKEIEYRFLANRIEHEEVVSQSKSFERFTIDTYDDYLDAVAKTKTNMFWGIPSDVIPNDKFEWDDYFNEYNVLDRNITHVFKNSEHYDGIVLHSTSVEVSKKEIEHRFYIDKKEHDKIASTPKKYDIFTIDNYDDYTEALYNTTSEMFWGVPSDVEIATDFEFDFYFSHHNRYDREINHIFKNGIHTDGVVLFSRHLLVSEKEVEHRFYIKKKEWDIVVSNPKTYPVFTVNNFADYEKALEQTDNEMFFIINDDIKPSVDFNWNFYISYHNQYERKINHVWKNKEFFDGVMLTNVHNPLTQREIDYRFLAVKKEYEEIASVPKPYDIVFISYNEPNADENFEQLKQQFPDRVIHRVHGVEGIHQAHIMAAQTAETEMFYVVDGDAQILDTFNFDYQIARYDIDGRSTVYVWRSYNPINSLVYGYGGVKLLPKQLTMDMDTNSADMTTSISKNFKAIPEMSNTTAFNTDAFSAWRSGFRECVKLASRSIDRQKDEETQFRLDAWCSKGVDKPFGDAAIAGAIHGRKYGESYANDSEALKKINDFEWLEEQFKLSYQPVE